MGMRSLVAFAAIILGILWSVPALACRCEHPSLEIARGADRVFAGEVSSLAKSASGKDDLIAVAVSDVWKGDVETGIVIASPATSCGLVTGGAKPERRFIFVARWDGKAWRARQCDGSRRETSTSRNTLTKIFGAPRAP